MKDLLAPFKKQFEYLSSNELKIIYVYNNKLLAIMELNSKDYIQLVNIQMLLDSYLSVTIKKLDKLFDDEMK